MPLDVDSCPFMPVPKKVNIIIFNQLLYPD